MLHPLESRSSSAGTRPSLRTTGVKKCDRPQQTALKRNALRFNRLFLHLRQINVKVLQLFSVRSSLELLRPYLQPFLRSRPSSNTTVANQTLTATTLRGRSVHLFLRSLLLTTSKALVPSSVALVPSSVLAPRSSFLFKASSRWVLA